MKYLTRFKVQKVIRALKDELVSGTGVRRGADTKRDGNCKYSAKSEKVLFYFFLLGPILEDSGISCNFLGGISPTGGAAPLHRAI